jgi:C1A family cysteine protease
MLRSFALASFLGNAVAVTDVNKQFEEFMERFERTYASKEEEAYRRTVFEENLMHIEAENAKGHSYTLGVTAFADLKFEEFRTKHLTGFVPSVKNKTLGTFRAPANFVEPESVDWSQKGAVTPVKNQAGCGSCWTFSATGALEGRAFTAGRPLVSLSEQMILDCDKGGSKCSGGSMDQAFQWLETNDICSEDTDSYKCSDKDSVQCKNSTCPAPGACTVVLKKGDVLGKVDVEVDQEGALEAAVAEGPVSVAIEADKTVFQHYKGGILKDEACGEALDHGVLAVGYGVDNGVKYWKVKNSWGPTFGEEGYIRIEKGSAQQGGECGIRRNAVYPKVAGPTEITV